MTIVWPKVLPVLVSIGIIITVAIVKEYSRTLAAIFATMPINIPLALWVVDSSGIDSQAFARFTEDLFFKIWPTIVFLIVAVLVTRAGWRLVPTLLVGYAAWAVALGLLTWFRS
jgi:hypothetical protein